MTNKLNFLSAMTVKLYIEQGMTSLYVYMSAITPSFVRNAFVPLLRTVPIERTTFVHEHVEFFKIQYLPVAYIDSEVAEVHMCSDRGNTVCINGRKMIVNFTFKKYTGK